MAGSHLPDFLEAGYKKRRWLKKMGGQDQARAQLWGGYRGGLSIHLADTRSLGFRIV